MGWATVKEKLPEMYKPVIAYYESGDMALDLIDSQGTFLFERIYGKVTHWMRLPKPPEATKEEDTE